MITAAKFRNDKDPIQKDINDVKTTAIKVKLPGKKLVAKSPPFHLSLDHFPSYSISSITL